LSSPEVTSLANLIRDKAKNTHRFMVAIAGAPASGKSTLAENLRDALIASGEKAIVVPMDGFHYDDAILNARGHRPRKGAPFTFDAPGFEVLLKRIKAGEKDIAIPVFDRTMELARAGADIVDDKARFILIEGNYLLLKQAPWSNLRPLFDFTIYLKVPLEELEQRLVKRWLDHGFDMAYATNWIASNDIHNIREVIDNSVAADHTLTNHD
jgi:pantothenate kinase